MLEMLGLKRPRTPLVLQMEAAECGAACLAMVLASHGNWITLEEARERTGAGRDGLDAGAIVAAAKSYGLTAVAFRREPETIADLPFPQIIHWSFNHFVVLEAVDNGRFTLLDPGRGRRTVDLKEFGDHFTGLTIAFEPSESFAKGGRPPSVTGALMREAMQSRDALAVSFACGVIGAIPALALTGTTGALTDYVLGAQQTSWVTPLVAVLVMIVLAKAALALLQMRTVASWRTKIGVISSLRGFWRALTLPLGYYAQRSAGEVVSRIRLGSEIGGTVAGPLADAMPQLALALVYLTVLGLFDPIIMAAALVAALVNLIALAAMARALADRNRELQVAEGKAAAAATSGLANIGAYRLLGREDLLLARWTAAEDEALDADQRLGRWRSIASLGPTASGLLLSLVTLVVGALRAVEGTLTLGDLVAVQMLAGLLNAPVAALATGLVQTQQAAGALMRLHDLEAHPPAAAFSNPSPVEPPAEARGRIVLEKVSFGYSAAHPLLRDVDLTLEPGKLVAVVGPSGAGKSTLVRLAAGLVEPNAGRITLDGIALDDYPPEELRRRLVYVAQQPVAFTGSITENITLWDPSVEPADVQLGLEATGFTQVLARRGTGPGARMSAESSGFSGGEMQRLALARAISRRPRMLVLDETTSALDPIAEEQMLAMLRKSGAAVLIVTHRPGTALRCDEAMLVAGGGIVARGDPAKVMALHNRAQARAA